MKQNKFLFAPAMDNCGYDIEWIEKMRAKNELALQESSKKIQNTKSTWIPNRQNLYPNEFRQDYNEPSVDISYLSPLERLRACNVSASELTNTPKWLNLFDNIPKANERAQSNGEQMLKVQGIYNFAGNPGSGKTLFVSEYALTIMKYGFKQTLIYACFDSGVDIFGDRKQAWYITELMNSGKMILLRQNELDENEVDLMSTLRELWHLKGDLSDILLIIDAYGDMVDDANSTTAGKKYLKELRPMTNAGLLAINISHNNKGGKEFSGNAEQNNKVDVLYQLRADSTRKNTSSSVYIELERSKPRYQFFQGKEIARFEIDMTKPSGDRVSFLEFADKTIVAEQTLKIDKKMLILEALKKAHQDKIAPIKQGYLLELAGLKPNDNTALKLLTKHNQLDGEFLWFCDERIENGRRTKYYSLEPFTNEVITIR